MKLTNCNTLVDWTAETSENDRDSIHAKFSDSCVVRINGYFSQQVSKALLEVTSGIEGASVEDNKFCVSVHYRNVDEKVKTLRLKHWTGCSLLPLLSVSPSADCLTVLPDRRTGSWSHGS